MYSVSDKYLSAIVADSRDMPYRVTLAGYLVLDQSRIPNMTLNESASGNSGIALGTANSTSLTLTLRDAEVVDYNDMLVEPESGLVLPDGTIEWVPLGRFWVTNSSTSNDYTTVTLTCADGMYHLTGKYVSELAYPTTVKAVVNEIIAKTGVNFVGFGSLPDVIIRRNPGEMTYRDAIGFAAGCCGCNARFNREGNLEFFWYSETGNTIERKTQYLDGMTRLNDKPLAVSFEVTGQQETYAVNIVSDGNGGVVATPGTNILEGDTVVLSINPFVNYELATLTASTESGANVTLSKSAEGGYTFVQPDSNVTVTASFRTSASGPFTLTVRAYDGGSIRASGSLFDKGSSPTVYIKADSGYELDSFVTTPANITLSRLGTNASGETLYEFTMPQSDVTISAYFKEQAVAYKINRLIDSDAPCYLLIQNASTGEYIWDATPGTIVSVGVTLGSGYAIDYFDSTVALIQEGANKYTFVMPAEEVSITAYFKMADDVSKSGQYSWLALPANNTPPTSKPYWAVFYKHDPSMPTCQRFYLVWFDSWSATGYESDGYGKRLYNIKFGGYYYCGSQNTGHYPQAWDTSAWSGNGSSGSTIEWYAFVGGYPWAGDPRYTGDYCLLASNIHLYYNDNIIFQMCSNAIQQSTTGYLVDGVDVREKGALGYYKCPDTFGTPAPAANWMIVNSRHSLLMDVDEDGNYTGYGSGWSGLYVVWFDNIAVENVGAVFTNSEEEFYIASVTNGHYVALCDDGGTWGTPRDVGENQVIGLRDPTISEDYISGALGGYYFNGLMAASCNINGSGKLLRYKNDCIICDCESVAPSTYSLRRGISTDYEEITVSYTNPMIYEKTVDSVSALVQGVTYTPAKVKHRGNPAFQAGDIVTVPDKNGTYHTVLIMQQTMTFGGGMNSEITCPGQTKAQADFAANGPITTQIKKAVAQSNAELEQRMSASNALVFAALHKTIGYNEAKIKSIVEWQTVTSSAIASINQTVGRHTASIESHAGLITQNSQAVTRVEQKATELGATLGLVAEYSGFSDVVKVDSTDNMEEWDKSKVYYAYSSETYYVFDSRPLYVLINDGVLNIVADSVSSTASTDTVFLTIDKATITTSGETVKILSPAESTSAWYPTNTPTAFSMASISQRVDANSANLEIVVKNGNVQAGIIMKAINDDDSAIKISADKLDIEGKTLNIKVDATNIEGKVTAEHIDVLGGLTVSKSELSGENQDGDVTTVHAGYVGVFDADGLGFSATGSEVKIVASDGYFMKVYYKGQLHGLAIRNGSVVADVITDE